MLHNVLSMNLEIENSIATTTSRMHYVAEYPKYDRMPSSKSQVVNPRFIAFIKADLRVVASGKSLGVSPASTVEDVLDKLRCQLGTPQDIKLQLLHKGRPMTVDQTLGNNAQYRVQHLAVGSLEGWYRTLTKRRLFEATGYSEQRFELIQKDKCHVVFRILTLRDCPASNNPKRFVRRQTFVKKFVENVPTSLRIIIVALLYKQNKRLKENSQELSQPLNPELVFCSNSISFSV